jgi:hypothetical protein
MGASDEAFLTRLAIAAGIVSPTRMDLTRFEEAHPAGDGIQELVADKGITAARCLAAPEASFRLLWCAQSTSFILTLSACSKRRTCKGWQVEHFRATGYRVWLFRFRLQRHTSVFRLGVILYEMVTGKDHSQARIGRRCFTPSPTKVRFWSELDPHSGFRVSLFRRYGMLQTD